jgi:hypothetical protein
MPYSIDSIQELAGLLEMARYYAAIPLLSNSLSTVLDNYIDDPASLIMEDACAALEVAYELRLPALFKDSFIAVLGPFHNPKFIDHPFKPELKRLLASKHDKFNSNFLRIQQWAMNEMISADDGSFVTFRSAVRGRVDESIRKFGRISFPWVCRKLYDIDLECDEVIQDMMEPIMCNHLILDHSYRKSGDGDCCRYFLYTKLENSELPWDMNQRDW